MLSNICLDNGNLGSQKNIIKYGYFSGIGWIDLSTGELAPFSADEYLAYSQTGCEDGANKVVEGGVKGACDSAVVISGVVGAAIYGGPVPAAIAATEAIIEIRDNKNIQDTCCGLLQILGSMQGDENDDDPSTQDRWQEAQANTSNNRENRYKEQKTHTPDRDIWHCEPDRSPQAGRRN